MSLTSTGSRTITDPVGNPIEGVVVIARLRPVNAAIRVDDLSVISGEVRATTNSSGYYEFELERNGNITPANTYWEIEERIPRLKGGTKIWAVVSGATDFNISTAGIVSVPEVFPDTPLSLEAADLRYLGVGDVGDVVTRTGAAQTVESRKVFNIGNLIDKGNQVYDIRAFGAIEGAYVNAAIAEALDEGPGGKILIPEGDWLLEEPIATGPGNNDITIEGLNWNSVLKPDPGITAISNAAAGSIEGLVVRNLFIDYGVNDHADNLGISLGDGTNPCLYWLIDHVRIRLGNNAIGAMLGKGIRLNFALEGVIQNSRVEFCGSGIEMAGESNANDIRGNKIRQNLIGIDTGAGISGSIELTANVIEGNGTGLKVQSGPATSAVSNHFENNSGSQIDVAVSAGTYLSKGNIYIFPITLTGECHVNSAHDYLTEIANNGTGLASIIMPSRSAAGYTLSGTGRFLVFDRNNMRGPASEDYRVSGGASLRLAKGSVGSGNGYWEVQSNNGFPQLIMANDAATEAFRILEAGLNNIQIIARAGKSLEIFAGNVLAATFDTSQNLSLAQRLLLTAATTARATLRVPHGTAPTTPVDGDIWTTTAGLFVRINGVTVGPLT